MERPLTKALAGVATVMLLAGLVHGADLGLPVRLRWDRNPEPEVNRYDARVWSGTNELRATAVGTNTLTFDLPHPGPWQAEVVAVATNGLRSDPSDPITFRFPSKPTGVGVEAVLVLTLNLKN